MQLSAEVSGGGGGGGWDHDRHKSNGDLFKRNFPRTKIVV